MKNLEGTHTEPSHEIFLFYTAYLVSGQNCPQIRGLHMNRAEQKLQILTINPLLISQQQITLWQILCNKTEHLGTLCLLGLELKIPHSPTLESLISMELSLDGSCHISGSMFNTFNFLRVTLSPIRPLNFSSTLLEGFCCIVLQLQRQTGCRNKRHPPRCGPQ